jgi:Uma2 family endonuclease
MRMRPAADLLTLAIMSADEAGIKLEIVDGVTTWEALPTIRHQTIVDQIRATIDRDPKAGSDCGCHHYSDIAVWFSDGSFKRPDIAIYRLRPTEIDEATTEIPNAVIEIVSKGYEAKDLQFGLPFYRSQSVADVVVYDPATLVILHATTAGTNRLTAPCQLILECGCRCQIP